MKKRTKITVLIAFLLLAVFAFFIGMTIYNAPHLDVAKAKPNIIISANKLLQDFESNENQANETYLDQVIEVEGVISEIAKAKGGDIVSLSAEEGFGSIMCHLLPDQSQIKILQPGNTVKIKGICTGYLMDVVLVNCVIINQ